MVEMHTIYAGSDNLPLERGIFFEMYTIYESIGIISLECGICFQGVYYLREQ
jgi:hypothetical protein